MLVLLYDEMKVEWKVERVKNTSGCGDKGLKYAARRRKLAFFGKDYSWNKKSFVLELNAKNIKLLLYDKCLKV